MGFHSQFFTKQFFVFILVAADFIWLTQAYCQPAPLKIGLSKASTNYVNWLKRADPTIQTVDLYLLPIATAVQQLGLCSGLLITGGEDVYPGRYGKEYDTARCTEMNPHRDSLEIALIERALSLKMPVVGICRGHQILNVYLGGSLIVDIPQDIGTRVTHQCEDYLRCFHRVNVAGGRRLAGISGCDTATVTTNHHQAVDRLAPSLMANATSGDHLIEGIEWKEPAGKSFLMGVQWHPERMEPANPLSGPLVREFLLQSARYSVINKR